MKRLLVFVLLSLPAFAQVTTINGSDTPKNSRAVINTNFSNLQTQKQNVNYAVDSGAADAAVVTLSPALASLFDGAFVTFKVVATNLTTTPTLNVNALGAKVIKKQQTTALAAGDLIINGIVSVRYSTDCVCWQMVSQAGTAAAGGGSTIPSTTNLIAGNGSGNGADSAISSVTPYTSAHSGGSSFQGIEYCRDDSFTITTDFQQAATSGQVKMFTAPAFWSPRSFRINESTTITAGGTVTAVYATIGNLANPTGYFPSFPLMGASSPAFKETAGGSTLATADNATQDVYLQLAVNGGPGNLAILTAGVVKVRSCGVVGQ
jgi:hypothetical protein